MSAKTETKITARILRMERGNLSTYGNPSWFLIVDEGDTLNDDGTVQRMNVNRYKTSSNAGISYGIDTSWTGSDVELTLTRAGRVLNVVKL